MNELSKELLEVLKKYNEKETTIYPQQEQEQEQEHKKYHIGKRVIVRCRDAGVHAGTLVDYYDRTAILKDSRRMYRFWCNKEHTLSGVARTGIRHSDSKIAGEIKGELVLPEFCEIIPFQNKEAEESVFSIEAYNEQ